MNKNEKSSRVIGYRAKTTGDVAPLFCRDCGEDVHRKSEQREDEQFLGEDVHRGVETLTKDDMENFKRAKCSLCESTFYTDSSGYIRGETDD